MIGFWLITLLLALTVSATFTALIFRLVGTRLFVKDVKDVKEPQDVSTRGNNNNQKLRVPFSGFLLLPMTLLSSLLALGILYYWNGQAVKTSLSDILETGIDPLFLIGTLLVIYLTGIMKDLSRVGESPYLFAQGICAALIVISDLRITSLQGLLSIGDLSSRSAIILTVLVILICINSVPALASTLEVGKGICSLALLYYCVILLGFGQYIFGTLAAAILGSNIIGGNFNLKNPLYRLGWTGGLTMGLVLSILAIGLCQSQITSSTWITINPVILALLPIIVLGTLEVFGLAHRTQTQED